MITINLLRISPDSEYLEFSVECPTGYIFNTLYIKRYNPNDIETTIDASNLYASNPTATKHIMRISISALGGTGMFQVEFGVTNIIYPIINLVSITTAPDPVIYDVGTRYYDSTTKNIYVVVPTEGDNIWELESAPQINTFYVFNNAYYIWNEINLITYTLPAELSNVISICSDVNSVYTYLLDNILNMNVDCLNQYDYENLTRNYMFLYAHMEAMRLERFEEAKMFYDILYNNFTNCSVDSRNATRIINNCNCQ